MNGGLMRAKINSLSSNFSTKSFLLLFSLFAAGCEMPSQSDLSSMTSTASTEPVQANNVGATGTQLLITGGNNQTIGVNSPAPRSLEIFAVDSRGIPMPGVVVDFEISSDFGTFSNSTNVISATTNSNGRVSVAFASGSQMGSGTIVATSSAGSAVFNFSVGLSASNITSGSLLLTAGGNNQIVAPNGTTTKAIEVVALSSLGSPMSGVIINFDILTPGAGTLTGGQTAASVTTGSNGRASINFTASSQTGPVSIIAASNAGSALFNLTVIASGATNSAGSMLLASNGNNQTVIQSQVASKNLEVTALNSLGAPISGVSVTFDVVTTGAGTFGGMSTSTVTTGSNGKASVTFTAGTQLGSASILATSSAGSSVFSLQIASSSNTTSSGSMLVITNGNEQNIIQGQAASRNLEVMALNSAGVPLSGVLVTYELMTAGAGTMNSGLTSTSATTSANGRTSVSFMASSQLGSASVIARSSAGSAVFTLHINEATNTSTAGSMLLVTNGNNQTVTQGQVAGKALEILALNNIGTPIPNLTVNFEVATTGAGTLTGNVTTKSVTTNSNGRASVNFTASSQLGAATVVATSTAGSTVFNLQVSNASSTSSTGSILLVTNGNNQTVVKNMDAGTDLEVMALDNLGMPIQGLNVTFQIATSGAGTLDGNVTSTVVTTDTNGKASIGFTAGSQLGSSTVLARSTAGSAAFNVQISNSSTSVYNGAVLLVTSGNNQSISQSTAATKNLEVMAIDNVGQPIQGVTVKFEVATSGAGLLAGGNTVANITTGANGKASIGFTAGSQLGSATVIASSTAGSAVFSLQINPVSTTNTASSMLLVTNGNNQTVIQSTAAAKSLEVMAIDNMGAPIQGLLVSFEVATTGAGTLTGGNATATATTNSNGKASVAFTADSQTGTASVVATSTAGSAVFNILVSGAASNSSAGSMLLVTNGNNQSIVKNTTAAAGLEVLALNSAGAPISGLAVKFELATSGAGTFTGGNTVATVNTNASGKASIGFTAGGTMQSATIVATSSAGSTAFNLQIINSATVNSLGSVLLITNGNNQTVTENATTGTGLEVLALNSAGAPIVGMPVNFEIATAGKGTLTGGNTVATATTDSNGKAYVDFTAGSSMGAASVVATSSAGSAVFNVTVISSSSISAIGSVLLVINGNNQTILKSTTAATDLEVMALNSAGAAISGTTITFKVATSGAGTLTGNSTTATATTDSAGKAHVSFNASAQVGSVSVVATSTAGSALFNLQIVNAATASTNTLGSALLITAGNNQVLEQNTAAPLDLEVLAVNSSGAPISGISVTFQVAAGAFSGGGTTKTLTTDSNGRAILGYTASTQLGPISIIATSSAGSNVFNMTIGAQGAGSALSISSGNGQLLLPNSTASSPLEVIATNSNGSPMASIPVTFTVTTTNGGVLSANLTQSVTINTDADGKASTSFKSSNYVGSVSILASSRIGSVTFSLNTNTVSSGSGGSGAVLVFSPSTLSPASTTWVTAEVGTNPSKAVTLTNAAATNVYLNSIFTTSTTPFKVVSDNCPRSPTAFATGTSCTVNITFSPTNSDTVSRFLFVNWSALNDGSNGTNAYLDLQGSGPAPLVFAGLTNASNTTTTSTQLNWVAASGGTNTQYRIYNTTGAANLIATLAPNSTSYTVSGLTPNSLYKFKAFAVNTAGVEDGNTSEITVTTGVLSGPALTTISNSVYPSTYIRSSFDTLTADVNSSITSNDTGPNGAITYACKFSRTVTGTGTSKVACASGTLGGTFSFNTATGYISWLPKFGTQGVFEFQITGTDSVGSTNQYFTVNVIHPYGSASAGVQNLSTIIADYRSSFANRTQQNATSATSWLNTLSSNYNATVTGTANFNGASSNTSADPEKFTFTNSTQVDFGQPLAGLDRFMIDYWVSNPEGSFTNGSTVLKMDTDNTDNGFKVTQNTMDNGQRALRFDFERSYRRVIVADNPISHWRMDETSGTAINDSTASNHATFADTSGSATSSGLVFAQAGATLGEKASTSISTNTNRIQLPNNASLKPSGDFSVEMWVKYPYRTTPASHDLYNFSTASTASGFSMQVLSGVLTVKYKPSGASTVTLTNNTNMTGYGNLFDSNWHHLVFSSTNALKILYFDGQILASDSTNNGAVTWPATPVNYWITSGGDSTNPTIVDETAIYGYALSQNQVRNHMAAADHFIRNQTLYPASPQLQARPAGFWRFTESDTNHVAPDYSGNQADALNWNGYIYRNSQGVYVRPGGSGLDTTAYASYNASNCPDYNSLHSVSSSRLLSFDQKFSFSQWVNINNTGNNGWLFSPFSTRTGNTIPLVMYWGNAGQIIIGFNGSTANLTPNYAFTASSVVASYSNSNGNAQGWYHIAMTFDGTQPAQNRVQIYVNGVAVRMGTVVGTIPSSLSAITGPGYEWHFGSMNGSGGCNWSQYQYYHSESTVFGRVLSANEIRAQAHEGSLRYCDVPVSSQWLDPYNGKPFDYINMLHNGTQFSVYRNSKLECALRPGVNLGSEGLNLVAGSSSNGFQGHMTDLRIHGGSGVNAASINDTHKAFMNSADQHRVVPLGNIVTDNLVRSYEASTAADGMRPYSTGNEDTKILWQENGNLPNGTRQEPGYLRGFYGSAGSKWNGTGVPTDPYRLSFDGAGYVDLGTSPIYDYSSKRMSVCSWMKTTNQSTYTLFHRGYSGNWGDFYISTSGTSNLYFGWNGSAGWNYIDGGSSKNATLRNGLWHYVCATYDASVTGTNTYLYIDGTVATSWGAVTADLNYYASHYARMTIGAPVKWHFWSWNSGDIFKGDIGAVHIYNSALSVTQIKQNCNAQAANYNMSTCAP